MNNHSLMKYVACLFLILNTTAIISMEQIAKQFDFDLSDISDSDSSNSDNSFAPDQRPLHINNPEILKNFVYTPRILAFARHEYNKLEIPKAKNRKIIHDEKNATIGALIHAQKTINEMLNDLNAIRLDYASKQKHRVAYSDDCKEKILQAYGSGMQLKDIAQASGIYPKTIRNWHTKQNSLIPQSIIKKHKKRKQK